MQAFLRKFTWQCKKLVINFINKQFFRFYTCWLFVVLLFVSSFCLRATCGLASGVLLSGVEEPERRIACLAGLFPSARCVRSKVRPVICGFSIGASQFTTEPNRGSCRSKPYKPSI